MGPRIGCVVDGCPPGLPLTAADIQAYLDKRRPGQSRITTQRREPDEVQILSGVFADETGAAGDDRNADRAADRQCRPALQGLRRHRRQVPPRPRRLHLHRRNTAFAIIAAAGARRRGRRRCGWRPVPWPARCWPASTIRGALVQIGPHRIDRGRWIWDEVDDNPFFCPDPVAAGDGRTISTACARPARRPAP